MAAAAPAVTAATDRGIRARAGRDPRAEALTVPLARLPRRAYECALVPRAGELRRVTDRASLTSPSRRAGLAAAPPGGAAV